MSFLILTVSYARWSIWMTINQCNKVSKEAGIIRKLLSLEASAIFQIYFYLQRLMSLHNDICVLFTPSEPGLPGTDNTDEGWPKSSWRWKHSKGPRQAAAKGQHKGMISPKGCIGGRGIWVGWRPWIWSGLWRLASPGDNSVLGRLARCYKRTRLAVKWICIFNKVGIFIKEHYSVLKGHSLASHFSYLNIAIKLYNCH